MSQLPFMCLTLTCHNFSCEFLCPTCRTCLTLLQGHTGLVCHLQLSPTRLITGGSDGRIIIFTFDPSSSNYKLTQSLVAHESSITSLHANERFLVTGGADGRARLFHFTEDQADDGGVNVKGGLDGKGGKVEKAVVGKYRYVRELSEPSENVWKVACTKDICVVLCRRAGKTDMEMWSFRPREV